VVVNTDEITGRMSIMTLVGKDVKGQDASEYTLENNTICQICNEVRTIKDNTQVTFNSLIPIDVYARHLRTNTKSPGRKDTFTLFICRTCADELMDKYPKLIIDEWDCTI